jgi:hypothetical protein
MNPYDRFFELLKSDFHPLLRSEGFKGSGITFRRFGDETLHIVKIQAHPYGGKCCVELGSHVLFLPVLRGDGSVTDPKKLKHFECTFHARLCEPGEPDRWFDYGITEADCAVGIATLIDVYGTHGRAFFQKFEPFPEACRVVTPADLDRGDTSRMPSLTTVVYAALTMARIAHHVKDAQRRQEFAEVGLRHLGNAKALRLELERLRDAS